MKDKKNQNEAIMDIITPKPLPTKSQKDSPNHCPKCDSTDIDFGCFDLIDADCWKQECECLDCGKHFTEHFTMKYDFTEFIDI